MKKFCNMTIRELKGRKVETLRPIRNNVIEIPPKSVLTIIGKFKGLALQGPTCPHCKIEPYITKVGFHNVRLLPLEDTEPMKPLEDFKKQLPAMPIERIESFRETLKHSVGGGTKSAVEVEVAKDFHAVIDQELARRNNVESN